MPTKSTKINHPRKFVPIRYKDSFNFDDRLPDLPHIHLKVAMAHYKGAASRADQQLKKREQAREELERMKQKIAEVS